MRTSIGVTLLAAALSTLIGLFAAPSAITLAEAETVVPVQGCVSPGKAVQVDQQLVDGTADLGPAYRVGVRLHLAGTDAKPFLIALVSETGAPAEVATADEVMVLAVAAPDAPPVPKYHVVIFKDGCKLTGGFLPREMIDSLLRAV